MRKNIIFNKSSIKILPSIDNDSFAEAYGKGWGYSYVYSFTELKDIFQALRLFGDFSTVHKFTNFCLELKIPYIKTPWNERRILENINALKNFKLINEKNNIINSNTFQSYIGKPLYSEDFLIFKNIFFSYPRFCEIHSWFINPDSTNIFQELNKVTYKNLVDNSRATFTISRESRFTDSLFFNLDDNPTLYKIYKSDLNLCVDEDKIRFWDVYTSWALSLNLIEKINLKKIGISASNSGKNIHLLYYTNKDYNKFDLLDFISKNYKSSYLNVANLILKVILKYRFSTNDAKDLIVNQCISNPKKLKFQRTSEAFIQDMDEMFLIKVGGSYVSHILVL